MINKDVDGNWYGDTTLILASENGHIEIVKFLISSGADINIKNDDGNTALMRSKNTEVAKYLIEKGADTTNMTIVEWSSIG